MSDHSDEERMLELANYRRGYLTIAEALIAAAGQPDPDVRAPEHLMRALAKREMSIDFPVVLRVFRCLLGLLCAKARATPRSLLEAEFAIAPDDESFREKVYGETP